MTRKLLLMLIVVLLVAPGVAGAADPQYTDRVSVIDGTQTMYQQTETPEANQTQFGVTVLNPANPERGCDETIDNTTSICSSSVDHQGRMTLVLYSDRYQQITLTDSGAFAAGGQVPQRTFTLQKGRNRVQWRIVTTAQLQGVAIGTQEVLYAEPIDSGGGKLLPGQPTISDTAIAGGTVFVMFASMLPLSFLMIRKYRGGEHDQH